MTSLSRTVFGNTPDMADDLLSLVLSGRKTATCWAAVHGDEGARVGQRVVVADGRDRDAAIIETLQLDMRRFDQVDEEWAFAEGEGDRTLHYWQRVHEAFFRGEGVFAPDMALWCERFRLVQVLDRETAQ